MIIGIFHQGSGLGNQLHRLVATRVKAADLGVDWAMIYTPDGSGKVSGFKGSGFMDIGIWNKGLKNKVFKFDPTGNTFSNVPLEPESESGFFAEKVVIDEFGNDIRNYDPEFNFIEDNTLIDGEFQDERYWAHREKEVDEWLKVAPLGSHDDLCVIGFRGGEYSVFPDLFLTSDYWDWAIVRMRKINPFIKKYEIHTDDIITAKKILEPLLYNGGYKVQYIHDIGLNWRSMRFAKYAIIANSSFYILPRWLRQGEGGAVTIAPRYWARRNTKIWALPQNYYSRFQYI